MESIVDIENSLIDFNATNESNLMVETKIGNSILEFYKYFSLKVAEKYLNFSKVLLGITTLLLTSRS